MNYNKNLGKLGEDIAIRFLKYKGYKVIEKNFSCRYGEIDIIAQNSKFLIFVEVKTRTNLNYGKPVEAVNKIKINHLYKATKYYLYKRRKSDIPIRFDVIEVFISKNYCKVNHIKKID